jgi:hypothetical protein
VWLQSETMYSMSNPVDKFRWYDWFVIFIVADLASAIIIVVMMGAIHLAVLLPLIMLSWMSYEDFRVRQENEKDGR